MELFAVGYVYFMSMLLDMMFECCRVYISCSEVAMWLLIFSFAMFVVSGVSFSPLLRFEQVLYETCVVLHVDS